MRATCPPSPRSDRLGPDQAPDQGAVWATAKGPGPPKVPGGMASAPEPIVPHPDTYADFPDITSTPIDVELFDALWAEAIAKFPELA